MDREQIIAALAPLYRLEADVYAQLGELAKEAAQEGDSPAFEAINRRAVNKSNFLDGMKAAVTALNIEENEFMKAGNTGLRSRHPASARRPRGAGRENQGDESGYLTPATERSYV